MSIPMFDMKQALFKIQNKSIPHPTNPTNPTNKGLNAEMSEKSGLSDGVSKKFEIDFLPTTPKNHFHNNTNVHTGQVSEEVIANIHYYGGYYKAEPFWEQIFKVSVIPCPYTAINGDIRLPWSWVEREQCHTRCKKRHKECVLEYIEALQRKQGETCA